MSTSVCTDAVLVFGAIDRIETDMALVIEHRPCGEGRCCTSLINTKEEVQESAGARDLIHSEGKEAIGNHIPAEAQLSTEEEGERSQRKSRSGVRKLR